MLDRNYLKEHTSVYIKSLIAGLAVCLLLMLVFSIIMRFTPVSEKWIGYYSLGIVSFACMFSGITAGYYKKRLGIINGIIHAAILILVLLVVYYFVVENIPLLNMVKLSHLICLVCGGIGGMIGVNAK